MSDLVKRLRHSGAYMGEHPLGQLMIDAADEIERLRAENEHQAKVIAAARQLEAGWGEWDDEPEEGCCDCCDLKLALREHDANTGEGTDLRSRLGELKTLRAHDLAVTKLNYGTDGNATGEER